METKIIEETKSKIIEEMMKAGCQYGRAKRFTHPSMRPFLLRNKRGNIEFFNLEKTLEGLEKVTNFLKKALSENKTILFVGAKPAAEEAIKIIADAFNMPYLNYKWVGGFLTNFETIKTRIAYFKELLEKEKSGEIENYPPKDKQRILRELEKMKKIYSGVINMENLPDVLFIVDLAYKSHKIALSEALKKNTPVCALAGSDNDVSKLEYFIPANDKAPSSIKFIINYLIEKIKGNG
jgi:small subunit ribosomal protein S2